MSSGAVVLGIIIIIAGVLLAVYETTASIGIMGTEFMSTKVHPYAEIGYALVAGGIAIIIYGALKRD